MILGKLIKKRRTALIMNFISFQAGWFLCVWAGAADKAGLGISVALVLLALHVAILRPFLAECALLLSIGVLGTAIDSSLIALGVFIPIHPSSMPWLCPLWLSVLWMLFASAQMVSLRWLWGKPALALLLGGIGGPMAYFGGYRMGAVEIGVNVYVAILSLSVVWALVTYLLSLVAERVDQYISQMPNQKSPDQAVADESGDVVREVL